jgi:peroxiredoxin Q/BCP
MAQLRQDYKQFSDRGAEVIVINPEGAAETAKFWEQERMPFPGLSDADHTVADAYDQTVSLLRMGRLPSVMVVDRDGVIRYAHQGKLMNDIPGTREVTDVLDRLNAGAQSAAATKVEA